MTRIRWILALPAFWLLATAGATQASEIRDKANLFSAAAVKKAESALDRVEKEYATPVTIETVESLEGQPIRDVATRHATEAKAKGIYVLISKDDHKTFAEASKSYRSALTRDRLNTIVEAIDRQFAKKDFDAGLSRGVAQIETTVSETHPAPANRRAGQPPIAGKPSSGGMSMLWTIGLGLLALFIVIRILGALFGGNRGYAGNSRMMGPGAPMGGPGYGGGGYGGGGGGGGGGFMSSMFGGIGGALAGNWLYDQFSGGRHHDSSMGSTNYDPNTGAAPADAGPEWGAGGAEGDWGGGDANAGGGDAGGDWGGGAADAGGGADWGGGGGGGGDWGGGGGGGGDDGGSW